VRAGATLWVSGSAVLSNPLALAGTLFDFSTGESWTGPIAFAGPSAVIDVRQLTTADVLPLTLSGTITGGAGFQKRGSGTLVLSGHNAYAGVTSLQAGTVSVQNSAGLGTRLAVVSAGATLEVSGGISVANPLILSDSTARLRSASGDNVWSGNITLSGKTADAIEVDADQFLISGRIAGTTFSEFPLRCGIDKAGAGTLVLTNANSLGLGNEVAGGVLELRNATAMGGAAGGSIRVDEGATLALDALAPKRGAVVSFSQALTLAGTGVEHQGALHSLQNSFWTGSVHLTGVTFVAVDSGTTLSLQNVSGVGLGKSLQNVSGDSLGKVGGGELDLPAANSYTGDTLVVQGTLVVGNAQALPTDAIVSPGAVLKVQPPANAPSFQIIGDSLTLLDGSTFQISRPSGGRIRPGSGSASVTWSGNITLAGRVNLIVDQNTSLVLSNFVSGTDGASFVKSGGGSLEMGGGPAATFATVLGPNGPNQIVLQDGGMDLNQENLSVSLATGYVPTIGQQFTLIDNQRPGGGVGGTFAGLADGSTFQVDGLTFQISYGRGNGILKGNGKVVITRTA
jgi:fibronectin-binding autotransporter adhesin